MHAHRAADQESHSLGEGVIGGAGDDDPTRRPICQEIDERDITGSATAI